MKKHIINFIILLIFSIVPFFVKAQTKEAVVKVTGEVVTPLTITTDEFQKFKQITVNRAKIKMVRIIPTLV